ncbi:MAG: PadR family transcriptional regulator [Oscillospiraceae bacterium]
MDDRSAAEARLAGFLCAGRTVPGESHGYKIVKDLSACIDISESTLYPILRRLETDGCLTVRSVEHNGRLRKLYTITERGLRRLDSFWPARRK